MKRTTDSYLKAYLLDCEYRNLSARSVAFYEEKISHFIKWLNGKPLDEVDSTTIKTYILSLQTTHNEGGVLTYFRGIRAFYNWYEKEFEGVVNPVAKLKAPKGKKQIIKGIQLDEINALIRSCENESCKKNRDMAILYLLADTGLRASELCNLKTDDLDLISGKIIVQKGKGNKKRIVFMGQKCRRIVRKYAKDKKQTVYFFGSEIPMTYTTLRQLLERRSKALHLSPPPSPHDFRRFYAVMNYRQGMDLITLAELMGHSSLEVLKLYLDIDEDDLRKKSIPLSPANLLH